MGQTSKSRTHSFGGCWTCRRRRVKCDSGAPTCRRCNNSGLTCEGYGFRFDIPEGVQSSRQNMPASSRPDLLLHLNNDEIDGHLADIDVASKTLHKGPFSLLVSPHGPAAGPQRPPEEQAMRLPSRSRSPSSTGRTRDGRVSKKPNNVSSDCPLKGSLIPQTHGHQRHPFILPELSSLNLHPIEHLLLHRYQHFVTTQLTPEGGFIHSAFAMVAPSMAISNIITPQAGSHASAAILHGILSAAAASLKSHSSAYHAQALQHERIAVQYLRLSVEENSDAYLTLAVAIMVLTVVENLFGHAHTVRAHTQAALRCLVLAAKQDPQDSVVKVIAEQAFFAAAISHVVPQAQVECLKMSFANGQLGYFEKQAGLAVGMLDILHDLNAIYAGGVAAPAETIENLERRLALHRPVKAETEAEDFDGRPRAILYYALQLYFVRAIRGLEPTHPDTLEAIEGGLGQLEALRYTGRESGNCLITWSACILGSECFLGVHQGRFMAWLQARTETQVLKAREILMMTGYSWKMKREMPERYRILWYRVGSDPGKGWHTNKPRDQEASAGSDQVASDQVTIGLTAALEQREAARSTRARVAQET
ncbi:uncharacterized protein RCC_01067 [Ramularia collo-cygni]|uniref:Zn(2)-C6 fungal-type domain-containing protein n=1 Tax=Ramularia collo-cygni TaxID=112498 RepID=A0A2D3V4G4_9PEZI|nr:uncharacterized protein RCC_01067 [Ramularia collo-cygni]CZT15183.1 uncharacterized protein RCC_01067 [Ramularia collo-cygni]